MAETNNVVSFVVDTQKQGWAMWIFFLFKSCFVLVVFFLFFFFFFPLVATVAALHNEGSGRVRPTRGSWHTLILLSFLPMSLHIDKTDPISKINQNFIVISNRDGIIASPT